MVGRRQALALSAASLALVPLSASAKVPGGYTLVKDATRGYAFIYPVGWEARARRGSPPPTL